MSQQAYSTETNEFEKNKKQTPGTKRTAMLRVATLHSIDLNHHGLPLLQFLMKALSAKHGPTGTEQHP